MLVLGRKIDEEIVIDNKMIVKVTLIENKTVRLEIKSKLKFHWNHIGTYMNTNHLVRDLKLNEVITINKNIKILAVKIGEQRVRLGFEIPKHINVVRKEIYNGQIMA